MEQQEIINKVYSYVFYAAGVLTLITAVIFSNAYLITLTALVLLASAVYLNSGHIVNNILIKRSNIIEIYNGYKLSNSLDSAVKKVGEGYHAVSIALLKIEKTNSATSEAIRTLIETLHESFGLRVSLREADKKRIVEELEVKRRMKEIMLTRIDHKSADKMNSLKREIAILEEEIKNIKKGGKALDVIVSVSTTGRAANEIDAANESSRGIKRVVEAFSSSLGIEYELLRGEELLGFIEESI